MKKCFAWVLVLAMLLSMCGVVIAAEDAPVASAADVVIEPQNAAPAAQDAGEGEEGSGETPTPVHTDHPVCGDAACTDGSHATDAEWKSLNEAYAAAGNKLPTAGNYYLTDDLTVSAALTADEGKTINLCLNGFELKRDGRTLSVTGGVLNICDCKGTGSVTTGGGNVLGGILYIAKKNKGTIPGTANLYGVTLKGGKTPAKGNGAAIAVSGSSHLNMYGGRIETSVATANGGAVYLNTGSALLDGVSITGCEAVNGSAIYVVGKYKPTLTIRGCSIQSNTASGNGAVYVEDGGNLVLSGAPSIQGNTKGNVYLAANTTFTLASDFSAAAKVGVSVAGVDSTTDTQTTFATSATDFSQCFTADADGVVTAYVTPAEGETDGKLILKKYQHIHAICGDASCEEKDHQIGEWTAWDGTGTIPTEGNVYLTANVTLTANLKPASGKTLNLCLNGYKLTRSNGRPINASGGTLTICDCAGRAETGEVYGTVAGELGGLAIVQNSGKLVLYGGTLTGGEVKKSASGKNGYGGAVSVSANSTFEMYGGVIENCSAEVAGGGVYAASATAKVTLAGGEIRNNTCTSYDGGGVYAGVGITLAGDIQINGNTKGGDANNLVLVSGKKVDASGLEDDAKIGIRVRNASTTAPTQFGTATKDVSGCFESNMGGMVVKYDSESGSLTLEVYKHEHPVCGDSATCTDDHADVVWQPWDGTRAALPTEDEVYVYLTDDVTLQENVIKPGAGKTLHLCLNGHTLKRSGGRPLSAPGGTLTLCDCPENTEVGKVVGMGAVQLGALAYVSKGGTFVLYSGTLTGGRTNKGSRGGAVAVGDGGKQFEMYGGVIENCKAEGDGGAVSLMSGTGIFAGGEIRNNTTGGNGGGVYTQVAVTVSGDVQIVENKKGANANNLYLSGSAAANIDALGSSARIGVTKPGAEGTVVARNAEDSDVSYFESDDSLNWGFEYKDADGTIVLKDVKDYGKHEHNVCNDPSCTEHEKLTWTPVKSATSIPTSGTVYLTRNVSLSSAVNVKNGATLTLCLNGFTVSRSGGRPFAVSGGGTLNICDCKGTGKIQGVNKNTARGGLIDVSGGSTLRLYGGLLSGGYAKKDANGKNGNGGAIALVGESTFEMYGGEIAGNHAEANGGGLFIQSNCTAILDGGSIHDNTAGEYGGGLYAARAAETELGATDVYDNTDGGGSESNTADMFIAGPRGGTGLKIPEASGNHKHSVCGEVGCTEHGGDVVWTEWTNSGALPAQGSFCLETDVDLGKGITVAPGTTLNICLNGHSITRAGGRIFTINGGTLNICDHENAGGQVIGASKKTLRGGIVDVRKPKGGTVGGTFNLYGGTLTGGLAVKDGKGKNGDGGAVYIGAGTFRMYGGEISGCAARNNGGAVVVSGSSSMLFAGGTISGNSAARAGGILVQAGAKLEMTGGSVLDNRANTGAGLYANNSEMTITGGTIAGNIAKEYGGGIRAAGSTVTLAGGTLDGDKAGKEGGGIYTSGETKLTIDGAVIENCRAEIAGGALRADASTTLLSSGTIRNNTSGKTGGAIYSSKGDLTFAGGIVSGNTAKTNGGGLYAKESDVTVSGTAFSANKAGENGGGILASKATITITGGSISDNKAVLGAGVLGESGSKVNMQGGTVSGNTASKNGGGVYVYGADVSMSGGVITGNRAAKGNGGGLRADKGTAFLSGGEIRENSASNNGGGVYISQGASLTFTGTTVQKNSAEHAGAGMYADSATLNLTGGTIAENDAVGDGGGLRADNCTITLDGVTIRANTTQGNGGGVCAGKQSKITMQSGLITENTAVGAAGGMVAQGVGTTMVMSGGSITKNTAETTGGGLYCSKVDLEMTGGDISENTASKAGGVFVTTNMKMTGGTIKNNTANTDGGGVRTAWGSTLELVDGEISGNTAQRYGGGVHCFGTYVQTGGSVSGNSASTSGGAVAARSGAVMEIRGGTLNDNSAASGGAVYVAPESACTITDATITGNTASKNGGAVFATGSLALLGGDLTGNAAEKLGGDVYLDASAGDGQSYLPGVYTLGGAPAVDDLHLTLGAAASIAGELEKGAKLGVTLEAGTLTQSIRGAFDYDKKSDGVYTLAAGDRSVTDPEQPVEVDLVAPTADELESSEPATEPGSDAQPVETVTGSSNTGLILGIIAAVVVIAAVTVIVLRQRAKRGKKESV